MRQLTATFDSQQPKKEGTMPVEGEENITMQKNDPNPLREQLRSYAKGRRGNLIQQREQAKQQLEKDPGYPARLRQDCQRIIEREIAEMRELLARCEPLVRKIKDYVSNITDDTVESGCYLLFSQALQSLDAVLLLAPGGFNHQIGELLRGVREALDLAFLFMVEGQGGSALREWFAGDLVANRNARKAFSTWINQGTANPVDAAGHKSAIYEALSHYPHMSYLGLLESVDVFAGDFDVSMTSGLHYVAHSALPMAKTQLDSMLVALKQYFAGRGDLATVSEIDQLRARF